MNHVFETVPDMSTAYPIYSTRCLRLQSSSHLRRAKDREVKEDNGSLGGLLFVDET